MHRKSSSKLENMFSNSDSEFAGPVNSDSEFTGPVNSESEFENIFLHFSCVSDTLFAFDFEVDR